MSTPVTELISVVVLVIQETDQINDFAHTRTYTVRLFANQNLHGLLEHQTSTLDYISFISILLVSKQSHLYYKEHGVDIGSHVI